MALGLNNMPKLPQLNLKRRRTPAGPLGAMAENGLPLSGGWGCANNHPGLESTTPPPGFKTSQPEEKKNMLFVKVKNVVSVVSLHTPTT